MSIINLSLHGVTAADLDAKCDRDGTLYISGSGQVAFDIGDVSVFFASPAIFSAWLKRLIELAENTPAVADAPDDVIDLPPALSGHPTCSEVGGAGYTCTRIEGHDGQHAAHGRTSDAPVYVWDAS